MVVAVEGVDAELAQGVKIVGATCQHCAPSLRRSVGRRRVRGRVWMRTRVSGRCRLAGAARARTDHHDHEGTPRQTEDTEREKGHRPWIFDGARPSKPIVLEDLIGRVLAKVGDSLRSEKDATVVVRARVRDCFSRLGFLTEA